MNVINEQVNHHKFGSGTITSQSMTIVTVEFCKEYGAKDFLYPLAFESFLELCNPGAKQKMDDELLENREREEFERKQRADEEEQRLEEERRILIEQRHTATKKQSGYKRSSVKTKK